MNARRSPKKGPTLFGHTEIVDKLGSEWFDSVCDRRSRRTFTGIEVEDDLLAKLEEVCLGFRPYPDARVELWKDPGSDLFRGFIGSYGKVTGSPHVLAFMAGDSEAAQVHLGYTGEAVVLEATRLRLDTCWVGGFFKHAAADAFAASENGDRVFAISPAGHASDRLSAAERLTRQVSGAHRRKPVEVIAPGLDETWPCWARAAVECARLAPSARNRQPWRFRMEGSGLVVSKDSSIELPLVTKALDCGIAMLHAELGALAAGVRGSWSDRADAGADVAVFKPAEA